MAGASSIIEVERQQKKEPAMPHIISGISSLLQHLQALEANPGSFRPPQCPSCGQAGLWAHGRYERKADRSSSSAESLNMIPIPRFLCPHCQKTCSVLPECIAPRRWYLWAVQQVVLLQLLSGGSLRAVSKAALPGYDTCRRWWRWLQDHFLPQRDALMTYCRTLSSQMNFKDFWTACFQKFSLAAAMQCCHASGLSIP